MSIFFGRLVDSRDIVELRLKQQDCEVTIRKKEAMPQPQSPAQPAMVYSPPSLAAPPAAPASTPTHAPAPATPAPSTSPPAAKSAKSSLPPLKSPMAGTFYRSPGPGEPAFVKVDLLYKFIFCIMLLAPFVPPLHVGTLSLGWRQSKEGASLVHYRGNEIDE